MSKTLVAIGGGSFQKNETILIDKYIIERTGKNNPNVIFIPAASNDDQGYSKRFKQYYRSLGCNVEALRLWHTKLDARCIQDRILHSDIIYFGGGDTTLLMQAILNFKLEETLQKAYEQSVVICGLSAGANILFTYGYSDSGDEMRLVKGCNLVEGLFCPHYQKPERKKFDEVCKRHINLKSYSCEDCHAVCFEENSIIKI